MATFEWGRKPENLTAANIVQLVSNPLGFVHEDFPLEDYPDLDLCNLRNENLFPITHVLNLCKQDHPNPAEGQARRYCLIEPALQLASRILLDCRGSFIPAVRSRSGDAELSKADVLAAILRVVGRLRLDFDYGYDLGYMPIQWDSDRSNHVQIHRHLLKVLASTSTRQSQKLSALVYIALKLCTVVFFAVMLQSKFKTGEGPECRDWEISMYGGDVRPIAENNCLLNIRGLALHREAEEAMKMDDEYQRRLFTEDQWNGGLVLWPPSSKRVRLPVFETDKWWRAEDGSLNGGLHDFRLMMQVKVRLGMLCRTFYTPEQRDLIAQSAAVGWRKGDFLNERLQSDSDEFEPEMESDSDEFEMEMESNSSEGDVPEISDTVSEGTSNALDTDSDGKGPAEERKRARLM